MTYFLFIIFGVVVGCGLCIMQVRRQPPEPENYLAGYCIQNRGRNLTGAYQSIEQEIESARQIQAELENEIEGYREQIDDLQTALRKAKATNSKLRQRLQQQPEQQPAVVERPNRFEFLEIKGGE